MHLGVIHSFIVGCAYTLFSWVPAVDNLKLFEFTQEHLPSIPVNFWGGVLLVAVAGHIFELLFRGRGIGAVAAMLGFMTWLYATIAYTFISPISILLSTMWPLCFWAWYYLSSIDYRRKLNAGLIPPID